VNLDPERQSAVHEAIVTEVRGQLARKRLSAVRAARALGWKQGYLARRMVGDVPFDTSDLVALAELLEVPVSVFFDTAGGFRKAPTSTPGPRNDLEDAA
jgi:hypothetical protein